MSNIVIIGAGQGAGQCVATLKKLSCAHKIILIGEESHPPYQRPPLSKSFLEGKVGLERVYMKNREFYEENEVEFYPNTLVKEIDREVKKFHNHPVLVISGQNWHEGVIGIVASRLKDKYNKPTILISLNKNEGKGSARSILGFNIGVQILKAVQLKILKKGGGHKMAGGFSIDEEKISAFRDLLINSFEEI